VALVVAAVGVLLGLGGYTLQYAEGLSYFSTDPRACTNCHIMQPQFDSWQKASHHGVAACVDCHLPHTLVSKYIAKADNGYRHSKGFTLQDFHEPILITEGNSRILQDNCVTCHQAITRDMFASPPHGPDRVRCVHCHVAVGHGARAGLGGAESPREREGETR
jgi:cytochrome c nitrite reductase small subunit